MVPAERRMRIGSLLGSAEEQLLRPRGVQRRTMAYVVSPPMETR
ncbi:hypothetical protein [Streptomyces cyaneofuscatus]